MNKRFFKNWVFHIPHRLRDLLWMVRAWSSIAPIFFFSFFNCFLKAIFWFKFLSSNSLIKESNIFGVFRKGVFREETCGISWSMIESTIIFLALIKFFLCKSFEAHLPLELDPLYSCRCPINFIQRDQIFPCLEFFSFTKLIIKLVWLVI